MKVVNLRKEPYDVYIGRENITYGLSESKWHNPFKTTQYSREDVLKMYEEYIIDSTLYDELHELEDKVLGCWCKPFECHGDVLVKLFYEKRLKEMFGFY